MFFKDRNIFGQDLCEIVQSFYFEQYEPGQEIMRHGQEGNNFYVIIKGIVSVSIPNQKIKNWKIRRFMHLQDIQWYEEIVSKYFEVKKSQSRNTSREGTPSKQDQQINLDKGTILTDEYVMSKQESML